MKVIDGAYKKRPQLNGDRFSDRYCLHLQSNENRYYLSLITIPVELGFYQTINLHSNSN